MVMFKKFMIVINLLGSLCVFAVMCLSKGLHKSKKYKKETVRNGWFWHSS